jgi:hypothetical protein
MDLEDMVWDIVDRIRVDQNRDKLRDFVNAVINLWIP